MKLGIFDIEGTLIDDQGKMPESIIEGLKKLHQKGVLTTIITSTGYVRLIDLLKENINFAISKGTPLITDNGGRIVDSTGKILSYHPLNEYEIEEALNFVKENNIKFLVFYPKNRTRAFIWVNRKQLISEFEAKYSYFADIVCLNLKQLGELIKNEEAAIIIFKVNSFKGIKMLSRKLNIVLNEGFMHVNHEGIGKDSAAKEIAKICEVKLKDVFVAGNYLNDLPLFKLQVGKKYFVGPHRTIVEDQEGITFIDSLKELGECLKT